MTAVGHVVKTMVVEIDTVAYECAVIGVTPTPAFSTLTLETACPDGVVSDAGPTTWTVVLDYAVDWATDSLHRLLNDPANDGVAAVLHWTPDPVGEPLVSQTMNVTLKPGSAPHRVGAFATATVTLPVKGAPTTADTSTARARKS